MKLSGTEHLLQIQQEHMDEHLKTAEDLRISLLVRAVVIEGLKEHALSEDERRWVRLAIKREARIEEFRTAVIEKTLLGIIWVVVVGIGYAVWAYIKLSLTTKS